MKRSCLIVLLLACAAFGAVGAAARDKGPHRFEVGAGADIYGLLGMVGGPVQHPGPRVFFEYRYFITDGWNAGVNVAYQFHTSDSSPQPPEPSFGFSNHIPGIVALTEYVFLPGRKVRPFVGGGMGFSALWQVYDDPGRQSPGIQCYGLLYPRVGVEFFGHLRLALEFRYAWEGEYGFSNDSSKGLSLSWVF